ncbi:hypothetical protein I2485_01270 [Nesterenkonia sp. E16_7]|uniref:DUF5719 family protein n=1 Tax=unclassified Nesterenkonia TaxID=2629769 RepID=UPI001A9290C4|nr:MULTISPECIES: DUF5719 family protein [unclassified Nesterenkonia]MBO0594515.1 hypothetical protein [Nesterenkonia sp. E16_10]MBO0597277.1 hypothetical protein [Nesterenkonia sp. E16_7]
MSAKKVRVKKLIKEQRQARRRAIRDQERAATRKAKRDAASARTELKTEEQRLRAERQAERQQQKSEQRQRKTEQRQRQDQERQRRAEQQRNTPAASPENTATSAAVPASVTTSDAATIPAAAEAAPGAAGPQPRPARTRRDRRGAKSRAAAVAVTAGVLATMVGSVALDGLMDGHSQTATGAPGEPQPASAALGAASVTAPQAGATFICPPLPGQPDSLTTDGQLEYRDRDSSADSRFSAVLFATDLNGSFPDSSWAQLNQEGRINETPVTEAPAAESIDPAESADAGLSQREAVHESALDVARPPLLEASAPPDGGALAAAALYEYEAQEGPVAGLAVGQCTAPERGQWFLGPEVAAGSTSLLTLANPFDRSATVEVTSVDSDGDRGASGTRSVVVPGQTTRSVNIAGLASAGSDLGVQVRSAGAPVTAQLQSSRAAGLTGTGVEFLPRLIAPGTEHLMPGVPIPEGVPDSAEQADEESTTPPELWIHVPGDQGATVELQVFGEDGQQVIETPGVFTVNGGEIDAVNLRGLEPGVSDIRVRTDVPAYVAVRSETETGSDFSWAAPAAALGEGSGTPLPQLGETELHLFASTASGSIAYRVMDTEGEFGPEQSIELQAEGASLISAEDLAAAAPEDGQEAAAIVFEDPQFDGEGSVHATMASTTEEGRFSLTSVSQLRGAQEHVPVRLLR